MALPLEDYYEDIIGKAQRGLGLSDAALIAETGIPADALTRAHSGTFEEPVARKLAATLNLHEDALVACGKKEWHPGIEPLPENLHQMTTDYKGVMEVNAYVAVHPESREALIFDTGADARPILDFFKQGDFSAIALLMTHNHGDHILGMDDIRKELSVPVYAVEGGAEADRRFQWGETLSLAGFKIETRRTTGHAADGTTFVFQLGSQMIAAVGDALFAGSMGGANDAWQEALQHSREQILSLPDSTLLCPGHGPVTTVELEKKNNPILAAGFSKIEDTSRKRASWSLTSSDTLRTWARGRVSPPRASVNAVDRKI